MCANLGTRELRRGGNCRTGEEFRTGEGNCRTGEGNYRTGVVFRTG